MKTALLIVWLVLFSLSLIFCVSLCITFHPWHKVKAIAAMSDYEKRIRSHRKHIIERVLTLACPRCSRAFIGFEGCFALKCSEYRFNDPNSCCQFCAYCLEDCGQDAHPHVRANTCPGNRGLFQPVEVFEDAQRSRRERMLRECVCCCTLFCLYCCCSLIVYSFWFCLPLLTGIWMALKVRMSAAKLLLISPASLTIWVLILKCFCKVQKLWEECRSAKEATTTELDHCLDQKSYIIKIKEN